MTDVVIIGAGVIGASVALHRGKTGVSDGFLRPLEILHGYLQGANVRWNAQVAALKPNAVRLADGSEIACGAIVNAAGAWASEIVDLPVTPLRRQVACTPETDKLPASMP